jgi:hypothetical protein
MEGFALPARSPGLCGPFQNPFPAPYKGTAKAEIQEISPRGGKIRPASNFGKKEVKSSFLRKCADPKIRLGACAHLFITLIFPLISSAFFPIDGSICYSNPFLVTLFFTFPGIDPG